MHGHICAMSDGKNWREGDTEPKLIFLPMNSDWKGWKLWISEGKIGRFQLATD